MTAPKPRTRAAILADWHAMRAEADAAVGDRRVGWKERNAQLADREAALYEEARQLPRIPDEIAVSACTFAATWFRDHARTMRQS